MKTPEDNYQDTIPELDKRELSEPNKENDMAARTRDFNVLRNIRDVSGPPKTDFAGKIIVPEPGSENLNKFELSEEQRADLWRAVWNYSNDKKLDTSLPKINQSQENLPLDTLEKLTEAEIDYLNWLDVTIPIIEHQIKAISKEQVAIWSTWEGSKAITPEDPRQPQLRKIRELDDILMYEFEKFSTELQIFIRDKKRLEEKIEKLELFNALPSHRKYVIRKADTLLAELEEEWSKNPEKMTKIIRADSRKSRPPEKRTSPEIVEEV